MQKTKEVISNYDYSGKLKEFVNKHIDKPIKLNLQIKKIIIGNKSKEEQLKDFKEIISTRADTTCKICFGRGYQGFDDNEQKYIPCPCVIKNIEKELAEANMPEANKKGIIEKFRNMFSLN